MPKAKPPYLKNTNAYWSNKVGKYGVFWFRLHLEIRVDAHMQLGSNFGKSTRACLYYDEFDWQGTKSLFVLRRATGETELLDCNGKFCNQQMIMLLQILVLFEINFHFKSKITSSVLQASIWTKIYYNRDFKVEKHFYGHSCVYFKETGCITKTHVPSTKSSHNETLLKNWTMQLQLHNAAT